jgi:hypothetical protein
VRSVAMEHGDERERSPGRGTIGREEQAKKKTRTD